jgi:hypothetical protein
MGDGNIARTVESGSKTPSSRIALCCSIRLGKGTSSSLVQPPTGTKSKSKYSLQFFSCVLQNLTAINFRNHSNNASINYGPCPSGNVTLTDFGSPV